MTAAHVQPLLLAFEPPSKRQASSHGQHSCQSYRQPNDVSQAPRLSGACGHKQECTSVPINAALSAPSNQLTQPSTALQSLQSIPVGDIAPAMHCGDAPPVAAPSSATLPQQQQLAGAGSSRRLPSSFGSNKSSHHIASSGVVQHMHHSYCNTSTTAGLSCLLHSHPLTAQPTAGSHGAGSVTQSMHATHGAVALVPGTMPCASVCVTTAADAAVSYHPASDVGDTASKSCQVQEHTMPVSITTHGVSSLVDATPSHVPIHASCASMKQCGVAPATAAPPTACPVKHVTTAEAAAVGKENAAAAASSYIPPAAADTSSSMQACSTSTATTIAPNRNSGSSSNSSAMPSALPTLHYRGTVRYAATAIEVDWVCGELLAAAPLVVGLDVEWKPNYVKGQAPGRAALIQVTACCHAAAVMLLLSCCLLHASPSVIRMMYI